MLDTKPTLCLLAHGFNVTDHGDRTIGRLMPYLSARQIDCIQFDMGWMGIIQVYTQNRKHARRLASAALNAKSLGYVVTAIGHSNGCCIIHSATTDYKAPIDHVVYLNPALNNDSAPGPLVKSCHVWHSPGDLAPKLARLLPASDWGDMGSVGYTGSDARVKNFNKQLMAVPSVSHSDFADEDKLAFYGYTIIKELMNEL